MIEHQLKKLKGKKILPPPWIAHPDMERYSIEWRMGGGESYIEEWGKWYKSLDELEQKEYQELFPEPITWLGYWEKKDLTECYVKDEYCVQFWQKNGAYKYLVETICKRFHAGEKLNYTMFWSGQPSADGSITKNCMSQWWMGEFWYEMNPYCCMEQVMMAEKAAVFGDEETRKEILNCNDPRLIKALGRKVRHFDDTVWNQVKYSIILNGNFMKFSQDPKLREFLLSTGNDILVEASPYDAIWGIRMSETHENAKNPTKWQGQNLLGFALMEVRDEIRRVWANVEICENV